MIRKLKIRESHWKEPNTGWHWDNPETNEYSFMYKGKTYRSDRVKDNTIIPWRTLNDCLSALVKKIGTDNLDISELIIHKTNSANYIIEQWSDEDAYNLILEFERTGRIKESLRNNTIKESDYGYTQNGEEIDESTVDELYRMAEYELLPQSELARVFGADNISIDEDSFEYYATGTAWGAYMKYNILIDVNTGSYGNRFNLNKFINPNYDDIRPDFDVTDVSFDIVVKVNGDEVIAEVDLNPRNINIEGDITDWFAKRFSKMLDIEAIENDVETIAERDVYEIKSVLSNI